MTKRKELSLDELEQVSGGTGQKGSYYYFTAEEIYTLQENVYVTLFKVLANGDLQKIGRGVYKKYILNSYSFPPTVTAYVVYNSKEYACLPGYGEYCIGPDRQ